MNTSDDASILAMLREGKSYREITRRTRAGSSRITRILKAASNACPPVYPKTPPMGGVSDGIDYPRLATLIAEKMQGVPQMSAVADISPEPLESLGDQITKESAQTALKFIKVKPRTIEEIAHGLDISVAQAEAWIAREQESGTLLTKHGDCWEMARSKPPGDPGSPMMEIFSQDDGSYTLGALGDSHLGSKYERLDVLNALYDRYEQEGVRTVFHTGNWVEGEARFNRHDISVFGMQSQLDYLARNYPQRQGVHTYAVAGDDHEGWWGQSSGVDIGWMAEQTMKRFGRKDWTDLGYMEAYIKLTHAKSGKSSTLAVLHPGGGSAYATSYTIQKIVESYSGGSKPAVLFAGHYHKMELINIRNVWCCQTGTQQDQTPFMRKKRLEAHVGGHVIRLKQDAASGAITEMNGMMRYFDVGFYNGRWSHSGEVVLPKRTLGGVA